MSLGTSSVGRVPPSRKLSRSLGARVRRGVVLARGTHRRRCAAPRSSRSLDCASRDRTQVVWIWVKHGWRTAPRAVGPQRGGVAALVVVREVDTFIPAVGEPTRRRCRSHRAVSRSRTTIPRARRHHDESSSRPGTTPPSRPGLRPSPGTPEEQRCRSGRARRTSARPGPRANERCRAARRTRGRTELPATPVDDLVDTSARRYTLDSREREFAPLTVPEQTPHESPSFGSFGRVDPPLGRDRVGPTRSVLEQYSAAYPSSPSVRRPCAAMPCRRR